MKKHILTVALLSTLSGAALAAERTFQASIDAMADATINESTPLHFGSIQPTVGASCVMDDASAVTGDCDVSDASIAMGLITVTGLSENVPVNVTVTGSSGAEVTFAAVYDINNADATYDGITDGTLTAVTTNGTGDDLTIDVYGSMTVDSALTAGSSYSANYTVSVVFQ